MLSKEAGLFTWDKPSYACLATRIPTGMKITGELLHAIESCENIPLSMGFSDFRVRVRDGYALLQVTESDYPKASASLDHIQQAFVAYFSKKLCWIRRYGKVYYIRACSSIKKARL